VVGGTGLSRGSLSTISTLPWTSPVSLRGGPRSSTARWGSLTPVLEIGCRTLSVGQPATSRGFREYAPWLTREGSGHDSLPFCPLGAPLQVCDVTTLRRRGIQSAPPVRGKRLFDGAFMGGVTSFLRSVRWRTATYQYAVAPPPFFLLPSAFLLSPFRCLSSPAVLRARAPPRAVANPPSFQPRFL